VLVHPRNAFQFFCERQYFFFLHAKGECPQTARKSSQISPKSGRSYFVMERVRGIRITNYCDIPHSGQLQICPF
jgi:hypothetical protein